MAGGKTPRRAVHGVLLLDKPQGLSSNTALQKARYLYLAQKAGHTGTLDPMATGLLPIAFGEATKFSSMLLDADKGYETCVLLGVATDSGDADGKVVSERPVSVDLAAVEQVLERFRGEIEQVPPMYSALKRDGKALYEYARAGVEIEREARRVRIHSLELLRVELPRLWLRVHCSKGTYIRSLAMDIGEALGCGAHLESLRRTVVGRFDLTQAVSLASLEALEMTEREALLLPVDAFLEALPRLDLDASQSLALCQGRALPWQGGGNGDLRLYGPEGFLGVGGVEAGLLKSRRLLATA